MDVVLYSTHCPKCNVLEKKLNQKNINFKEVNDIEIMKDKNIFSVPVLEVDGNMMDFATASKWVNTQED